MAEGRRQGAEGRWRKDGELEVGSWRLGAKRGYAAKRIKNIE